MCGRCQRLHRDADAGDNAISELRCGACTAMPILATMPYPSCVAALAPRCRSWPAAEEGAARPGPCAGADGGLLAGVRDEGCCAAPRVFDRAPVMARQVLTTGYWPAYVMKGADDWRTRRC